MDTDVEIFIGGGRRYERVFDLLIPRKSGECLNNRARFSLS